MPPIQFLQQLRLERALELLETTHLPFGEIAYRVCYADSWTLGFLMRRSLGASPRELRERPRARPRRFRHHLHWSTLPEALARIAGHFSRSPVLPRGAVNDIPKGLARAISTIEPEIEFAKIFVDVVRSCFSMSCTKNPLEIRPIGYG